MAHEDYLYIKLETSASGKHRGRKKEKMGCSNTLHPGRNISSKNNCWENNRERNFHLRVRITVLRVYIYIYIYIYIYEC